MTSQQPYAANHRPRTAVESIARAIAIDILSGRRPAGTSLPPLRSLAKTHEVTLPTVQRVVAWLEAQGLVTVRQGSGVVVRDPHATGELSLIPLWFEALSPDEGAEMLADVLALRREVVVGLVTRSGGAILRASPRLGQVVLRMMGARDLETRLERDLEFSHELLRACGSFAAKAMFRTVERLIREVPWIAEAFYGDAKGHDEILSAAVAALGTEDIGTALGAALTVWDARAVARYRMLVGS